LRLDSFALANPPFSALEPTPGVAQRSCWNDLGIAIRIFGFRIFGFRIFGFHVFDNRRRAECIGALQLRRDL
jgi:hypothetical protein